MPAEFDTRSRLIPYRNPTADEIAIRFVGWLQSHPHLRGQAIRSDQIEIQLYPDFCEAIDWPPVCWRDFAKALGKRMKKGRPRKKGEARSTVYIVPEAAPER